MDGRGRRFAVVSWFVFLAFYLLFCGTVSPSEVGAGAAAATVTLFLVGLLRDKFKRPLLVKLSWFRLLWRIPIAMVTESWLLLKELVWRLLGKKEAEGTFIYHDFPAQVDEHDAARRAFMTFGVCITPNSYLIYYDSEKRKVLIRQLVGKELSEIDRLFVELP